LFAEVVQRVEIPEQTAEWIAEALRESQADKEQFHRTSVMRLQQQYLSVQAKLDRAYEDRLAGKISDELWLRKSAEWEAELESTRRETAKHERASHDYGVTGSKILELAKTAYSLFKQQDPAEQAKLLRILHRTARSTVELFIPPTVSRLISWSEGTKVGMGWATGIRTPITCPEAKRTKASVTDCHLSIWSATRCSRLKRRGSEAKPAGFREGEFGREAEGKVLANRIVHNRSWHDHAWP